MNDREHLIESAEYECSQVWEEIWKVCGGEAVRGGRCALRARREARRGHMGDTYLKQHDAPEDVEYYLCGPPMMAKTVLDLLHSLGVDDADIRFDNFR